MTQRSAVSRSLRFAIALACFSSVAFAQGISRGTITGTVSDATGAVIPGVAITATHIQTGTTRIVETNENGVYAISSTPAGAYDVVAEADGFQRKAMRGIELQAEQRVGLDIALEIGEITTTVEVTGAAPVLETESGEVSTLVSEVQVAEMPINGRN